MVNVVLYLIIPLQASSKSKEEFENGIVAGLLGDSFVQNGSSITLKNLSCRLYKS